MYVNASKYYSAYQSFVTEENKLHKISHHLLFYELIKKASEVRRMPKCEFIDQRL